MNAYTQPDLCFIEIIIVVSLAITCLLSLCLHSKNMHRVDMESVEVTSKVQSLFFISLAWVCWVFSFCFPCS